MKTIDIYEPECQRNKGRGFKNNDVKRGYMSEPMDDYPIEHTKADQRKWRNESRERWGD